jgi:hypothetical protein
MINMPRMNDCGLVRVRTPLLKMVVVFNEIVEKKCKFIQFVAIFWFLKLGQSLENFENMKQLLNILKVKNTLSKQQF